MNGKRADATDTLLFILLTCVFTACVFLVLIFSVRVYRSVSGASDTTYRIRTSTAYITEKLRHGDAAGAVYVGQFDGLNALYIESDYSDTTYTDILYFSDGWLNELFCEKGAAFGKDDGTRIIPSGSVLFSEPSPGLFSVALSEPGGNTNRLLISLRSGG